MVISKRVSAEQAGEACFLSSLALSIYEVLRGSSSCSLAGNALQGDHATAADKRAWGGPSGGHLVAAVAVLWTADAGHSQSCRRIHPLRQRCL